MEKMVRPVFHRSRPRHATTYEVAHKEMDRPSKEGIQSPANYSGWMAPTEPDGRVRLRVNSSMEPKKMTVLPSISGRLAPVHPLPKKDDGGENVPDVGTPERRRAFQEVKTGLVSTLMLAHDAPAKRDVKVNDQDDVWQRYSAQLRLTESLDDTDPGRCPADGSDPLRTLTTAINEDAFEERAERPPGVPSHTADEEERPPPISSQGAQLLPRRSNGDRQLPQRCTSE